MKRERPKQGSTKRGKERKNRKENCMYMWLLNVERSCRIMYVKASLLSIDKIPKRISSKGQIYARERRNMTRKKEMSKSKKVVL